MKKAGFLIAALMPTLGFADNPWMVGDGTEPTNIVETVARAMGCEHADVRRYALEAIRRREGVSSNDMASVLFVVATNRMDKFALHELSRYATGTNHLDGLAALVADATLTDDFHVRAFQAFARIDGYGERTLGLVDEILAQNITLTNDEKYRIAFYLKRKVPSTSAYRGLFDGRIALLQIEE